MFFFQFYIWCILYKWNISVLCNSLYRCVIICEAYDVLLVLDSSLALVHGHDAGNPSRFIASDICHPTTRVREFFGKLCWGKGLSQIIEGIKAGLDEIEEKCRTENRPIKPILVMVGWAGNDVWGRGGYKGVTWIHKAGLVTKLGSLGGKDPRYKFQACCLLDDPIWLAQICFNYAVSPIISQSIAILRKASEKGRGN